MASWFRRVGDMIRASMVAAIALLGPAAVPALADPEISVYYGKLTLLDGGEVDFGQARQGRGLLKTITIINSGTDPLDISNVQVPEGFELALAPMDSVSPRRATVLRLNVPAEAEPGLLEGELVIASTDESEPEFRLTIRAEVIPVAPDLTVKIGTTEILPDSAVDFGATLEGVAVSRAFIVSNTGNADLRVQEISVSGRAYAVTFRKPVVLKPGRRASFPVRLLGSSDVGAGFFEEVLTIRTNDPDENEAEFKVPLTGTVAEAIPGILLLEGGAPIVPGANISYGRYVGRAVTKTFTIRNTGREDLRIGQIVADGVGFRVDTQAKSPIRPGRGSRFSVRMLADNPGEAPSAVVRIPTNIAGAEEVNFTVSAEFTQLGPEVNVTGPRGVIGPVADVNLGTIDTGAQASFTLGISNATGTADLLVSGVTLTGTGFNIVAQPAATVRAGGATSLRVTYTAGLLPGTATGVLRFATNDTDEPSFTVNISVTSVAPPSRAAISVAKLLFSDGGGEPVPIPLVNGATEPFGATDIGTPQDRLFRISNTSQNGNLTVSSVTITSTVGTFEVTTWFPNGTPPTFPLVLTPNSNLTFTLTCPGATSGLNQGKITVVSDATRVEDQTFVVNVTCDVRVISGKLEVTRATTPPTPVNRNETITVGASVIGGTSAANFTLVNNGVLPLTLSNATSSTGDFIIETQPPATLAVQATAPFGIKMVTATAGAKSSLITIPSDDQDGPFAFTVTGVVNNWFPVGAGLGPNGSSVRVITEIDIDGNGAGASVPYAGGTFTTPGDRIARFVSGSWQALPGGGLSGQVNAIAAWDNDGDLSNGVLLVAGGDFTTAGGSSANRVAVWNGSTWSSIGPGGSNGVSGVVNALFALDEDGNPVTPSILYIGGRFATAGNGTTVNNVTRYNGTQFFPMGAIPGVGGSPTAQVNAFLPFDPDGSAATIFPQRGLVIAGDFTTAGGAPEVNNIFVYLDNPIGAQQRINKMSVGTNGPVHCLTYWDPDGPVGGAGTYPVQVVAGGNFTTAGGISADKVAYFGRNPGAGNTPVWNAVKGGATDGVVNALSVYDEDGALGPDIPTLFAGGTFSTINANTAVRIARFDGRAREWQPLGVGANMAVRAMNPSGINLAGTNVVPVSRLYVGGDFSSIGGINVGFIASWGTAAP